MTEPRRSLWRHADFLKLWTAESISQVGTQVTQLALPLAAIVVLEATPFEVALLGTIEFLPFILLGLPAGVWVDRLRRRPILIAGDLGRAIALGSIPIAFVLGVLTIWQLYVVGFVVGCFTVFFDVAYQSYLPSIVERDDLVEGNAKLEISRSGAALVGPTIAGVLVEWLKAPVAILVDSISYLGSALFVFLIRRHEPEPVHPDVAAGGERPKMRQDIAQGLRYVLGHRYLRWIALSTAVSNLFSNMLFAIYLVYVVRELGLSAGTIGVIFAIGNIGFLTGAVVASRLERLTGLGLAIVLGAVLAAIGVLLIPLATAGTAFVLLVAAGLLVGFGNVVYNVNQVSFRQAITPERMQGRMNATMRFIVWGTIPVGSLVGGVLGTAIGLLPTIWIGAIGGLTAILPLVLTPVRSLRRIPTSPEEYEAVEAARTGRAAAGGVTAAEVTAAEDGAASAQGAVAAAMEAEDAMPGVVAGAGPMPSPGWEPVAANDDPLAP